MRRRKFATDECGLSLIVLDSNWRDHCHVPGGSLGMDN